jgi:hypothetical protein
MSGRSAAPRPRLVRAVLSTSLLACRGILFKLFDRCGLDKGRVQGPVREAWSSAKRCLAAWTAASRDPAQGLECCAGKRLPCCCRGQTLLAFANEFPDQVDRSRVSGSRIAPKRGGSRGLTVGHIAAGCRILWVRASVRNTFYDRAKSQMLVSINMTDQIVMSGEIFSPFPAACARAAMVQAGRELRSIPVAIARARSSTARLIAVTTALSSMLATGSVNAVCSEINVDRPVPSMIAQRATRTTS